MKLPRFTLPRVYLPTETLGSIYSPENELICKTMELPWKMNQRGVSCIPEGVYVFEKQLPKADRPYGYFRARAIPGRSLHPTIVDKFGNPMSSILIHRITFVKDLLGCIGVGGRFHDFNKDGVPDMAESSSKLDWMYRNLPDVFELEIKRKI
jgi:hypothetical protein